MVQPAIVPRNPGRRLTPGDLLNTIVPALELEGFECRSFSEADLVVQSGSTVVHIDFDIREVAAVTPTAGLTDGPDLWSKQVEPESRELGTRHDVARLIAFRAAAKNYDARRAEA